MVPALNRAGVQTATAPTVLVPTATTSTALAPTATAPTATAPTATAPTALAPTALAPTATAPTALAPTATAPTATTPTAIAPTATVPAGVIPSRDREGALRKLLIATTLALLCIPSLILFWNFRDVPHFGVLQDDSLYVSAAKSIAAGSEYRIQSLPAQPYQTKYPPLYPLYLSLAWLANPSFPSNLTTALALTWISLPVILILLYRLRQTWLVIALFALNPYVLFYACNIGSELFFLALLLGAILAAEKRWPLLSGVLAGAAYLTRTAALPLLPAAIVYFLIQRNPRAAMRFALGMLPAMLGWFFWCQMHRTPGHDIVTLYYTNYVGYQFLNVGWDNFATVLWKNFDSLLESIGSLVFPQMLNGLAGKVILQPIAIAMVLGCIRMVRRGEAVLYAMFAVLAAAMMLVWHAPTNQRYVLPLAPLLLAGFCCEMSHLIQVLRTAFAHRDRSQRVVAYAFTAAVALVLASGLGLQIYMSAFAVPELFAADRQNDRAFNQVYTWITAHLPPASNILWEQDVVYYLVTGRHATSHVIPTREWYAHEFDRDLDYFRNIDRYARAQHLSYILLAAIGPHRNEDSIRALNANPNLEKIHQQPGAIVYRVK